MKDLVKGVCRRCGAEDFLRTRGPEKGCCQFTDACIIRSLETKNEQAVKLLDQYLGLVFNSGGEGVDDALVRKAIEILSGFSPFGRDPKHTSLTEDDVKRLANSTDKP